jgi:GGDEF domain-containing protein
VGTTASLGIALLHQGDSLNAERLMMQADSAMYAAKHAGGDGVTVFEPAPGAEPAAAAG